MSSDELKNYRSPMSEPTTYRMVWAEKYEKLEARNARLIAVIKDSIESLERNSTSAPVVECLKAALQQSTEKP